MGTAKRKARFIEMQIVPGESGASSSVVDLLPELPRQPTQRIEVELDRESVDALVVCIAAHSGLSLNDLVKRLLVKEARLLEEASPPTL